MSAPFDYAELHCLTNHSFLRGASHPDELVLRAAELGYRALAITDECSVAGVVKAWRPIKDKRVSLQLIIGSEFRFDDQLLVLLATNRAGYAQLCQLITRARRRSDKGDYRIQRADFEQQLDDCLCLWQPSGHPDDLKRLHGFQKDFPDRCWVLVENLLDEGAFKRAERACNLASQAGIPAVCANAVLMHRPERKELQDALTAIRHRQSLDQIWPELKPNAENHLRSFNKLRSLYPADLLAQTMVIADRCRFDLSELSYSYPSDLVPGQFSAPEYLRLLVRQGARRRHPQGTTEAFERQLDTELALIREKGYEHYFLTVYDIVRFARSQGILCQGRGSAANSAVCYCLGITEVDPVAGKLVFERFISSGRHEPPDIDVDFEHERREEVIQYLYRRYGRKRAALAATVISYRPKSAVRDVGRALGLDLAQLERRLANYGWRYRSKNWIDELVQDTGLGLSAQQIAVFKRLLAAILGFPRHLSQHVGGFVLTDQRIADYVPIENATMADRTVIQWDKDDLEAVGLMKVDVLALGMLTAVRKTLDLIRQHQGEAIRLQNINRNDADVYAMIQRADTIGVFQIESRAQMSMLPRLKPKQFYDLVVQVAIVRPGPIHGDMVHPYLRRRLGQEKVDYPNAALEDILKRTLGIPIFQEQVISLAQKAANFTADEANTLRSSMASWKKTGHISDLRGKLQANMRANGYSEEFIQRINRQIEGFGEYGFPESHATGFAMIAYVSAWLKHYHPAAFCCALLNSLPMGFYSASQLVQDVRRHGVEVRPVDINASDWDSTLEPANEGWAIRLGLRRVKRLSDNAALALVAQRPEGGYRHLRQLEGVPGLTRRDLDALAAADAFHSLVEHRHQARWESAALNLQAPLLKDAFDTRTEADSYTLPAPDALDNLAEDYHSQGLTLGPHPVRLLRERGQLPVSCPADQLLVLAEAEQARLQRLAEQHGLPLPDHVRLPVQVLGLVTNRQMPKTSTRITFVTLEDDTGNINVIVRLSLAQSSLKVLTTRSLIRVSGTLEKAFDNDVIHVLADRLEALDAEVELRIRSRDYH
ncbi:error-prone DNA polymerase [Saccharospirillum mangrovi]|uniref:error-prone DNA polymerase n=1 Tax=Saccharospirillum mangrovi TaxID=2161747 RepID=UPI000D3A92EB|nr:error-prone DNA polymerase [Saccharospirillum mangrovi]